MSALEQLALTELWPCTTCQGTGHVEDRETGVDHTCPTCRGAGTLEYDPDDKSVIPF